MEMLKRFEPLALCVIVLAALCWGAVGLFDKNMIGEIFGTGTLADVVYVVIGLAGLIHVPKALAAIGLGDRMTHAG
jgi:uncharacterized membrane protein YuzA (DUF378 family)